MNRSLLPASVVFLSVFLLSLCVLSFEVSLTRLFSVVLRYHFVFMVVSIAVCGLGLGGLVLHQFANREREPNESLYFLAKLAWGFSLTLVLAVLLLLKVLLPFHPSWYLATGSVILIPFFFAGMFLAHAFRLYAAESGKLYFADLAGASTASLLVILLLQGFGAINANLVIAVLGCGCAVFLSFAAKNRPEERESESEAKEEESVRLSHASRILYHESRVTHHVLPTLSLVILVMLLGLNMKYRFLDIPIVHSSSPNVTKPLFVELGDPRSDARIIHTEWNAFARTDVVEEQGKTMRYIYTDGEVPTHMERFDGDLSKVTHLRRFIGFFPYYFGNKDRVLCIGPGGGLDVLLGFLGGAKQIDGVEINPSIVRTVDRYADFNGHIYQYQNVNVVTGEGRSYLRRSTNQYDLIYLALTQTATAGNVGLALVESYIHTQDAFEDYLRHLTSDGRLVMITQEYPLLLRSYTTALGALRATGVKTDSEAAQHLALFRVPEELFFATPYRHLLMLKRSPFTGLESNQMLRRAGQLGLTPLYLPGNVEPLPFSLTRSPAGLAGLVEQTRNEMGIDVTPCTDDWPFFLDLSFGVPSELIQLSIGALLLLLAFTVLSVFTHHNSGVTSHASPLTHHASRITFFLYFAALGVGFMLIEISLAQKLILFLGYPTLSLSVILFSLLLGGGLGSYASQFCFQRKLNQGIFGAALVVVFLVLLYSACIPMVQSHWLRQDIYQRSLITMMLLLPLGIALGVPFPTGLRALRVVQEEWVPWVWGVNGVMSVVGSLLAVMMAKFLGFRAVLIAGAVVYLIAALIGLKLGETTERTETPL